MSRILIVDDSPTETFRFKEILTKNGFEVIEAANGADGVTMAQAELPDLVLMDVVMPTHSNRDCQYQRPSNRPSLGETSRGE